MLNIEIKLILGLGPGLKATQNYVLRLGRAVHLHIHTQNWTSGSDDDGDKHPTPVPWGWQLSALFK